MDEPVYQFDQAKCSSLVLDTYPPITHPPSSGASDGFDGILHIREGDFGGASGTIFFLFVSPGYISIHTLMWSTIQ